MEINEKLLKALKSATTHLENSMSALDKKDDDSFANSLWRVLSELEYTLFLFSITFSDESNLPMWKPNSELKKIDMGSILVQIKKLLSESERFIMNEKLLDAYKNTYIGKHCILKVQDDIAKKKRDAFRKK